MGLRMNMVIAFFLIFEATFSLCSPYERSTFFGVLKKDAEGKDIISEHPSRVVATGPRVLVRVKNIKNSNGRVRIAVWSDKGLYTREDVPPNRAVSHPSKSGEMVFEITGLELGQAYSFFAHHDQGDKGRVERILGILPKDPYIFSNKANGGKGAGLKRNGLRPQAPLFEDTLVTLTNDRQEIQLIF